MVILEQGKGAESKWFGAFVFFYFVEAYMEEILSAVSSEVFSVWFLIGAALVFWMQAGFAMCEAGFTRA